MLEQHQPVRGRGARCGLGHPAVSASPSGWGQGPRPTAGGDPRSPPRLSQWEAPSPGGVLGGKQPRFHLCWQPWWFLSRPWAAAASGTTSAFPVRRAGTWGGTGNGVKEVKGPLGPHSPCPAASPAVPWSSLGAGAQRVPPPSSAPAPPALHPRVLLAGWMLQPWDGGGLPAPSSVQGDGDIPSWPWGQDGAWLRG